MSSSRRCTRRSSCVARAPAAFLVPPFPQGNGVEDLCHERNLSWVSGSRHRSRIATFGWYWCLARLRSVRRCNRQCRGVCGRWFFSFLSSSSSHSSSAATAWRTFSTMAFRKGSCHLTGLISCGCAGSSPLRTGPRSEHLEEGGHQRNRFIHPCFVCIGRSFGWQSLKDTPSPRLVSSRLTLFVAGVQCRRGRVVLQTNRVPVRDAHLVLENVPVVLAVNSGGSASGFGFWMVLLRARSAAHPGNLGRQACSFP